MSSYKNLCISSSFSKVSQVDDDRKVIRRKASSSTNGTQGLKLSFLCLIVCVVLILFVVGKFKTYQFMLFSITFKNLFNTLISNRILYGFNESDS